jgi:protein-disulfide isomerase
VRRIADITTVLLFIAAAYLVAQPSSLVRSSWTRHWTDRTTFRAAKRHWSEMEQAGSRLFSARGRVEVVVISDYECPFCRASQAAIDSAVARGVGIALLHYPGPSHPNAEGAARAAICAEPSGHFPRLHAQLMQTDLWQKDEDWLREAGAAGVIEIEQFGACVTGEDARKRLLFQTELADSLLVTGTPTFVSLSGVHRGVASLSQLLELAGRR